MQNRRFIEILDELKDETSDMLLYGNMMDSRIKEKYLRKLEKIRYELFENVNLENKYSNEEDISFVNNKYKARKEKNILNIQKNIQKKEDIYLKKIANNYIQYINKINSNKKSSSNFSISLLAKPIILLYLSKTIIVSFLFL